MCEPYIFQIVGYSKTGKTTIIEELVESLQRKDYTVFTIKSARTHIYEYSTKDSDRFMKSGAVASAVFFDNLTQISFQKQYRIESIIQNVVQTTKCDLVIIEGFKDLSYPKVLLWSEEILENNVLDYTTIRYLYSPAEQISSNHVSIISMIEDNKIILVRSIEELTSSIIKELESS